MNRHRSVMLGFAVASLVAGIVACAFLDAFPPAPAAGQVPPVVLRPELTIGVEEGDESLMFGDVVRIDVDGRGHIYALDYKFHRISIFDQNGKFVRTIAVPEGQGPREAINPGGLAVTPGGTLFVNDMQKVIVYGPDGGYLRTLQIGFMISSIGCAGTEELIAIGPHEGKILHVFDLQGKLLASFGDIFVPPGELVSLKDMPMFGAPLLFSCAKDGRIFVTNPHKYEVSVFRDRKLERVFEGRNDTFKPLEKRGRVFLSTAAFVIASGDLTFVSFRMIDPAAKKTADVFRDGKQIGSIELKGLLYASDAQGRVYVAEDEGFPKIVRYAVTRN